MLKFIFLLVFVSLYSFLYFNWWNKVCFLFCLFFLMSFTSCWSGFSTCISMSFCIDNLSYMMILLSVWVGVLSMMSSKSVIYSNYSNEFFLNLIFLLLSLFFTFCCFNFFMFFFFFECSLIPTLFLILGWGYKIERIQSGFYFLFYTVFGSIPMFMCIFYHFLMFNNMFFEYMMFYQNFFFFFSLVFGFLVKMPMFLVHSWLPKAHVEAPVSGSMILAGVLLKLGGYGLLKFCKSIASILADMGYFFICISLVGGVISSFICIRQTDLKSLIAYSSISHMSLVIVGILCQNTWGLYSSIFMMVAHGLCSSALFFLTNLNYERSGSRSIYLNKGLMNVLPNMSMWWFLFICCNMSCPPSLNFLSEVGLINSILCWSLWSMVFVGLISFLGACYSLYLFSFTQHGSFYSVLNCFYSCFVSDFLVVFLHWIPLNLMFFCMNMFC
uniref:NADH dehydrogenase subunit 4 n=1 Tax=Aeolothrips xinjiangensis TaxID=2942826 RepID=UPI0020283D31|nr:NADH dehydrogenase subunit 4 [Aeolothrips xinjiangensis]UQJ77474.1 NADH dehydrogenase subunit 4 [Aeolothrips xinjiangensis]